MRLHKTFYTRSDVVVVAKQLLGKKLVTNINGQYTAGIITETEAYCGKTDKACHAYMNKNTNRTKVMFEEGGICYVYLCYGLHHLLNIVTNTKGNADAVLIRAIEPVEGIDIIKERRKIKKLHKTLTTGPGVVSKALGINIHHNTISLIESNNIWIENTATNITENNIIATTRIGIDYAEEDALLPWRFYIKDSKWISKK